ncbi:hypothetical protein ACF08B_38205 [Streptomyces sp. NPDC015139]|uniref:hypothetical protein n=1 Tax=Streptomyces sp. NPDC015139 TaxID=3364942 RepID=UPI0036FD522C
METAGEAGQRLRSAADTVAREARRLAAVLDDEAAKPRWTQPAQNRSRPELGLPAALYTHAALALLQAAHQAMAAAVATDRTAGNGWAAIAAALGTSEDTAARRYRPGTKGARNTRR